jgi:FkbM family methyltransferase
MQRLVYFLKSFGMYVVRPGAGAWRSVLWTYVVISLVDELRLPRRSVNVFGTQFIFPDTFAMRFLIEELILARHYAVWPPKRDDPLIVDAGANIGLATLYFKRLFPAARVVSVEAHPVTAGYLRQNVLTAGFSDVEVVERALTGRPGSRRVAGTNITATVSEEPVDGAIAVDSVLLSDLVGPDETIDILKLDIEGGELEVLRSISEELPRIDQIVAEIHMSERKPDALPEVLEILARGGHHYEVLHWSFADEYATCIVRTWRRASGKRPQRPLSL